MDIRIEDVLSVENVLIYSIDMIFFYIFYILCKKCKLMRTKFIIISVLVFFIRSS